MKSLFASFIALGISLTACGGDPLDPGAGNDPGTGTNTLFVEGRATAEPTIPNTQRDTDFRTEFSIRITLNNIPVTTGTVTIQSRLSETPLTFNTGEMRWQGVAAAYDEVYQLDVISGVDKVTGVIVDGPDLHVIKTPTAGASVDSTLANDLKWDRNDMADLASFRTGDIDRITIPDSGTYSIPPGSFKAEKDQSRENTIELRRTNHVAPKGAIVGSDFAVSVQQEITVLALPNPAL